MLVLSNNSLFSVISTLNFLIPFDSPVKVDSLTSSESADIILASAPI